MKTLNETIRELLDKKPGLKSGELFDLVPHQTTRRIVNARLCNMRERGYVVRDTEARYFLTGKKMEPRGSKPKTVRVRKRKTRAEEARRDPLVESIDWFLRRPVPG